MKRTELESASIRDGDFLEAIRVERRYQDRKWGGSTHDREHSIAEWAFILSCEIGEAMIALRDALNGGDMREFRAELVQVAAVCKAISDQIDGEQDR
jgi:hypothetical protein